MYPGEVRIWLGKSERELASLDGPVLVSLDQPVSLGLLEPGLRQALQGPARAQGQGQGQPAKFSLGQP